MNKPSNHNQQCSQCIPLSSSASAELPDYQRLFMSGLVATDSQRRSWPGRFLPLSILAALHADLIQLSEQLMGHMFGVLLWAQNELDPLGRCVWWSQGHEQEEQGEVKWDFQKTQSHESLHIRTLHTACLLNDHHTHPHINLCTCTNTCSMLTGSRSLLAN